jgi:hypothetical protein
MIETILKYLSVYLISMIKVFFGPVTGIVGDLSVLETALFTILGMMTSVVVILLIGSKGRTWLINKLGLEKRIANSSYRTKKLWDNFGVQGIAFITPLISPILGAVIAHMFEASRRKIVKYMLVSAIFWGLTLSFLFNKIGTEIFGF